MMAKCDVCGRPATTQVTVRENGKSRQIARCDEHYAEVMGHADAGVSPLESLFRGGLFDEFFGSAGSPFDAPQRAARRAPQGRAGRQPVPRSREAVDLRSFLNEAAMDRL